MQITRPDAGSLTCDWLWHDDREVMFQSFYSHVRTPFDFVSLSPLRRTWVARNLLHADVKQAVS